MSEEKILKMAVIAGASSALKYKEKNRLASDQEVLRYVTKEAKKIVNELDKD